MTNNCSSPWKYLRADIRLILTLDSTSKSKTITPNSCLQNCCSTEI